MTDDDRDALLLDVATGLRNLISRELGLKATTTAPNTTLRDIYDKLDRRIAAERMAGIPGPHNLLGKRR